MERSCRRVSALAAGDTVVRQVQWSAAVQTLVNYHCQLEEHPIGDVKPMKLIMQYLIQAAVKLPSAGDDARSRAQHAVACP